MKRIMVVEDTKSVREEIVTILEFENFDVVEAENGMVGFEYATKYLPDLIVCDVLMPELDGFGLLRLLREEPSTSTIPFIFLTAKAAKEDWRGGMELGADDYLTKPFTPEELINAIRTRIDKHDNINKQNETKFEALCENIVYALPHEFITPLTAILGFSELLIDTSKENNVIKIAEGINNSGKRLERLIQNFLIYSQVEVLLSNPKKVSETQRMSITNPGSIIKEVAFSKAKQFKREKDIVIDVDEANVQITTENIRKMIEELVDNAIKFSTPNSPINIKVNMTKEFYTIEILDNGRGMSPDQISNIGSYMQFDRKLYEQQGMGLGLIIAKRLVELHDGSMNIDSEIGKGTRIIIKLKSRPLDKSKKSNYTIDELEMSEMVQ